MIIKENIFRDVARLIVWYPLRFIISVLPASAFHSVCKLMALIHFIVAGKQRKNIRMNIELVFGEKVNSAICCLRYLEMHYIDRLWIFFLPRLNKDNIKMFHSLSGTEKLDEALGKGKGCILVHGHLGPSQMPLLELNMGKYNVTQIGYHAEEHLSYIGKKVALRLRKKYEGMIPAKIIFGNKFMRPVFNVLKNNGVIMTAGDGTGGGRYVGRYIPVKFLGEILPFPVGPIMLSRKTGAQILPAFTIRNGRNKFLTIIEEPISVESSGDEEKDILSYISCFTDRLESKVRLHPDLWHFWDEIALMKEDAVRMDL